MGETTTWDDVKRLLGIFFPQYLDSESEDHVPDDVLEALGPIAERARPYCLSVEEQNLAQALYLAYLISLRRDTMTGRVTKQMGPVVSEREGDIATTYADLSRAPELISQKPSSDPWDQWNQLWKRCGRGAITSRFGDPARRYTTPMEVTRELAPMAYGVWQTVL